MSQREISVYQVYCERVFMAEMIPPTSTPKPITEISGSGLLAGGRLESSWFMIAGSGRWNLNPAMFNSRFLGPLFAALLGALGTAARVNALFETGLTVDGARPGSRDRGEDAVWAPAHSVNVSSAIGINFVTRPMSLPDLVSTSGHPLSRELPTCGALLPRLRASLRRRPCNSFKFLPVQLTTIVLQLANTGELQFCFHHRRARRFPALTVSFFC